ncbi:MAG TPA: AMP-binding protein [Opitutaceae bacterium]|nr:AMP-binding protein [Opitutaceae bacterium]
MDRAGLARKLGALAGPRQDRPVVVEERDPAAFLRRFSAAAAGAGPVFLADPSWGPAERAALHGAMGAAGEEDPERGWLMVPTGGSSGRIRFARHDQETIGAAVGGFCAGLGAERPSFVGVLPLHHVSGLMAWMRAALTGGAYLPWDWKRLAAGERPEAPGGPGWFLSLVPTQLQRLLGDPEAAAWMRRFQAVFVGGGPLWPDLAEAASRARIPLSPGYGMTETAAMVATLPPEGFLAGRRTSGAALPHARLSLTREGRVRVNSPALFRGYFPDWSEGDEFETEDLGALDGRGELTLLGRRDALIVTGGEKVDPAEVEAALRASGQFEDVAVVALPDPQWGEAVVACHPAGPRAPDAARVAAALAVLAPFKRPRRIVALADWPRTAQGKINRSELARRIGLVSE